MGNLTVAAITVIGNCNGCIFVCLLFPALIVQNKSLLTSASIRYQEMEVFLMFQSRKQVIRPVLPRCQNQPDLIFWKCWQPACALVFLFPATSNVPGIALKKNPKPKYQTKKTPNLFTCIITHVSFSFLSTV